MGWTHRCNMVFDYVDRTSNGAFVTSTTYVRCTECSRTGVSGVQTEMDPTFRDGIIDRQ